MLILSIKPYETKLSIKLDIFNEVCIWVTMYTCLIFSGAVTPLIVDDGASNYAELVKELMIRGDWRQSTTGYFLAGLTSF